MWELPSLPRHPSMEVLFCSMEFLLCIFWSGFFHVRVEFASQLHGSFHVVFYLNIMYLMYTTDLICMVKHIIIYMNCSLISLFFQGEESMDNSSLNLISWGAKVHNLILKLLGYWVEKGRMWTISFNADQIRKNYTIRNLKTSKIKLEKKFCCRKIWMECETYISNEPRKTL